jgi:uncharacterized protein (TIGR03118 family)
LLVNPWGISLTASSPFWVANNGSATTQLIRGVGSGPVMLNLSPQTVTIPGDLPTGTVANPVATEFVLPGACAAAPCGANFLFASITGNILGWDPNAPAAGSTTAVIAVHPPNASPSHPPAAPAIPNVYTGLAYANNGSGNFLYAANFSVGRIDVFNSSFVLQPTASFPFADPTIPTTAGNDFHPFNIQAIGGSLYVAYAKVGTDGEDEEGVGNGFVRRFNANGVRDLTFGINNGALNSPWGITLAPATFGIFGGALIVGNFGEGNPSIHAYNPTTGAFLGTIQDESGNGIVIDELWAIIFGNGGNGGDVNTLYFSAGPGEEEHGLFGKLQPTTASATSLIQLSTDEYAINESSGHIDITVTRSGDVSGAATINYNTFEESGTGHASQKSDYGIALGTLRFAPGETSKTFRILLINDVFVEGDETIDLMVSNPTGAGVGLGTPNVAELTIIDNDLVAPTTNPIDDIPFFVRQMYVDFLAREPDATGFTNYVNLLTGCPGGGFGLTHPECDRVRVAASFYSSPEFGERGYLVYRYYDAALARLPQYPEFIRDLLRIGGAQTPAESEAAKVLLFQEYVNSSDFQLIYGGLTDSAHASQFVAKLELTAGVTLPEPFRANLISQMQGGTLTADQVLRQFIEHSVVFNKFFNRGFVAMLYFGLLHRNPDTIGFGNWLTQLNSTGDQRPIVFGFIYSTEYRARFGPP